MKMRIINVGEVRVQVSVVPVVVVTACGEAVRETAKVALLADLRGSVWVDYQIARSGEVRRRVGGWDGPVYDDLLELDHGCVSCTVREDLVPTVERLAGDGRWDSVVIFPPPAASPIGPAHQLHDAWVGKQLTSAQLASVVSFVDLDALVEDLFGDDLLDDRGLALGERDRRSVGEALAEQLEFSDVVVAVAGSDLTGGEADRSVLGEQVLRRMVAPSTRCHLDWTELDPATLLAVTHDHRVARDRVDPLRVWPIHHDGPVHHDWPVHQDGPVREDGSVHRDGSVHQGGSLHHDESDRHEERGAVWTLALTSSEPLHPADLQEQLEQLGTGRIRARGYFWLSSRPDDACAWDASGGQLSIGTIGGWSGVRPGTRLVVTGVDLRDRERIERAFDELVSRSADRRDRAPVRPDGFEPWLG